MSMKIKTRDIVMIGLLIAVNIVLDELFSITIIPGLIISFGFVGNMLIGTFFPAPAAAGIAFVCDLVGIFLFPKGPFFPGYTLSAVLAGFIYGFFLYKKKASNWGIFWLCFIINFGVNLVLGTAWAYMLYGGDFFVLLGARSIKNLISFAYQFIIIRLLKARLDMIPNIN